MGEAMRIYVGGVGPTVTAADIEKTFSSLGRVGGVELVRSNGRSFAYMDFEPTSDKTLAKLFSTYNGCTWKGGKLKLERAKEHYLERLKREWVEDAKLMSQKPIDPPEEKDAGTSKLERVNLENLQLRIFFPKLRKVKSLPFKGTGKHKYSFQRIEVPPLPIHFCDCEEHRELSEAASEKYFSSLISGIHYEKELSIMNSVMNKLFDKENIQVIDDKETTLAAANISDPSTGDILDEESQEAMDMDDDNIVTNIGVNSLDDILMQLKEEKLAAKQPQEPRVGEHQSSKKVLTQNKAYTRKRQIAAAADAFEVAANKRAHEEVPVKITENEFTGFLPQNSQEQEVLAEPSSKSQTEPSMTTTQSTKGHSLLEKTSWRGLVREAMNSSFSLTNVLPDVSPIPKQELNDSTLKKSKALRDRKKSKKLAVIEASLSEKEAIDEKMLEKEDCIKANEDAFEVTADERVHKESPVEINENGTTAILPQTEGHSQDQEASVEPPNKGQTEPNTITSQSARGQFWLQKSSWRDLVGETGSTSFSITNVVPGFSSLLPKQPNSNDSIIETLGAAKKTKSPPDMNKSKQLPVMQDPLSGKESADEKIQVKGDSIQANEDVNELKQPQMTINKQPVKTMPVVGVREVCTFMRSAESEKEWSKARSALSKYLKKQDGKKNSEDDSRKNMTGSRPHKRR